MKFESICDQQTAKEAAKRIFERYRTGKGELVQNDVGSMMKDAYFNIQKGYNPSSDDINGYIQGLDANGDGKVTLEDLEAKAVRYLCGGFSIPISQRSASPPKLQRKFTKLVKNNLSVAKRLFQKYQDPLDKTITEQQVPYLIKETYESIGRKDYEPTDEDIRIWMQLCDTNGDGKVIFEEYEQFVIKSLEKAGIKLYEE